MGAFHHPLTYFDLLYAGALAIALLWDLLRNRRPPRTAPPPGPGPNNAGEREAFSPPSAEGNNPPGSVSGPTPRPD
jgi:hypothetical protein